MAQQAKIKVQTVYKELPKPEKYLIKIQDAENTANVSDRNANIEQILSLLRWADDGGKDYEGPE